jgi:hypothetical protein
VPNRFIVPPLSYTPMPQRSYSLWDKAKSLAGRDYDKYIRPIVKPFTEFPEPGEVTSPMQKPAVQAGLGLLGSVGSIFDEGMGIRNEDSFVKTKDGSTINLGKLSIAGMPNSPGKAIAGALGKVTKASKAARAAEAKAVQDAALAKHKAWLEAPVVSKTPEALVAQGVERGTLSPGAVEPPPFQPSRRLAAPESEFPPVGPVVPGSPSTLTPGLGIRPKSAQERTAGNFPFLPNRVLGQTEGTAKSQIGALAPENLAGRVPEKSPIVKAREAGYVADPYAQKQLAAQGVPSHPELPPNFRPGGPVRPPTDLPPMALDEFYKNPPVQPPQLPSLGRKPLIDYGQSKVGTELSRWAQSIENRFRNAGPAGEKVADFYRAYRTDKGVIGGNWESQYNDILSEIPKGQFEQVRAGLETGQPLANPALEAARLKMAALDKEMVDAALKAQLKLRGETGKPLVPFTPHENYWPHIYPPEFWDDSANVANALAKKYNLPIEVATDVVGRASVNGGKLVLESERIGKEMAERFGPQLKGFQHGRELNLEGYRTDPDAYRIHIRDMADRLSAKKYFGDLDIAGKPGEDAFATLIQQAKGPDDIKQLLVRVFNREGKHPTAGATKVANAVMTASTLKNLSMFFWNNLVQNAALVSQGSIKGLAKGIASIPRRAMRLKSGLEGGALNPVHSDAISGLEGATNKVSRATNQAFSISRGEIFNRSLSSVVGRGTAESLHAEFLRNPNNARVRAQLEKLTMTTGEELLQQKTLTKLQLDRAAGVMSEATQGRAQSFDLPYHWTGGSSAPYKNLALQFKKYPFVQAKLFVNAMAQNPAQTLLAGVPAYYAASEGIQAGKDAKRAAVASIGSPKTFGQAWKEEREKHGSGLPRVASVLANSWMVGLPTDIMQGAVTKGGLVKAAVPVSASDVQDLFNAGIGAATNKTAKTRQEAWQKEINKMIPYIGRDINATHFAPKSYGSRFGPVGPALKSPTGNRFLQ